MTRKSGRRLSRQSGSRGSIHKLRTEGATHEAEIDRPGRRPGPRVSDRDRRCRRRRRSIKPDTLLAIDLNRAAVINGIVANWSRSSSGGHGKSPARYALPGCARTACMAASLAPSFDGLAVVMNTNDTASVRARCQSAKALGMRSPRRGLHAGKPAAWSDPANRLSRGVPGCGADSRPVKCGTYSIQSGTLACVTQLRRSGSIRPRATEGVRHSVPTSRCDIRCCGNGPTFGNTATLGEHVVISAASTHWRVNQGLTSSGPGPSGSAQRRRRPVGYFTRPPIGGMLPA